MNSTDKQNIMTFYRYPPVGEDDWRYTFATARARTLETRMLTQATFLDITNAESYEQAANLLAGTEYEAIPGVKAFTDVENILLENRALIRGLFADLMLDKSIIDIWRAREDFSNMRLAVRRVVTEQALELDYSHDGAVPPTDFEEVFEQENYGLFPDYLQEAVEQAILGYYKNKDIQEIDYAIDRVEWAYRLKKAYELKSIFLQSLFRTKIDLTNIRTMLRLKWREGEQRDVFVEGGFIELSRYRQGIDIEYKALPGLFFATPYYEIIEAGVDYLNSESSFLRLEQQCERHLINFLKTTNTITAGPQPIIAYFLMKENEIRKVRLVLTCKKHVLDVNLILDRLGER